MGIRDWLRGSDEADPYASVVPTLDGMPSDIPWVSEPSRTIRTLPYNADRPLVASARKIDLKSQTDLSALVDQPYTEWQNDAWDYFDAIGEIKFALRMASAVMSRIRLYAAVVVEEDAPPVSVLDFIRKRREVEGTEEADDAENDVLEMPEGVNDEILDFAKKAVDDLGSGNGGIPGLMSAYALNLTVAGECYLVNHKRRWSIRSTQEVTVRRGDNTPIMRTTRNARPGSLSTSLREVRASEIELPSSTYIGRIWNPHPRYSDEPDSSMIALRELCSELMTLQRMIRSTARSRMNAGLLFLPDGLSVAAQTPGAEEIEVDPLEYELMVAMTTPVSDEASASNVVPMLVRGPAELGAQIRYLSFARDGDARLVDRADRVLERILQGLDVPKDIVTGLANVKYANAVAIDDSLYKSHIEPLALTFVDALTTMYLRQAIRSAFPDITEEALRKIVVWYDPSEVTTKPDPAAAADSGYDKHVLSGDAWRRAHGFSETDAPTQSELAERMAREKITLTPLPEGVASALVNHYLPTVMAKQRDEQRAALPVPFPDSARRLLGETEDQVAAEEPSTAEPEAEPAEDAPFTDDTVPSGRTARRRTARKTPFPSTDPME